MRHSASMSYLTVAHSHHMHMYVDQCYKNRIVLLLLLTPIYEAIFSELPNTSGRATHCQKICYVQALT